MLKCYFKQFCFNLKHNKIIEKCTILILHVLALSRISTMTDSKVIAKHVISIPALQMCYLYSPKNR